MDKMKMITTDRANENFKKLSELFPNAITETIDESGVVVRAIDKDILMQEVSTLVVDSSQERYQFTWPDKHKAVVLANAPITKTLRLNKEKSVGRGGERSDIETENIYIEGDNLDALKLLQETYLGKIKLIYIDPPYNTGNDFVYNDDYKQGEDEYSNNSGQTDDDGNRLVQNSESNGRFHTDWLNMMYPRLKIAKDLLADDGVIFISIDDHEAANLTKATNEIFGESCFVSDIAWQRTYAPRNDSKGISNEKEHLLVYSKTPNWTPRKLPRTAEMNAKYKSPDGDPVLWRPDNPCAPGATSHQGMVYAIQNPFTGEYIYPSSGAHWRYQQSEMLSIMALWGDYILKDLHDEEKRAIICGVDAKTVRQGVQGIVLSSDLNNARTYAESVLEKGNWPLYYFTKNGEGGIAKKTYLNEENGKVVTNLWNCAETGHTDEAKKELLLLFNGNAPFDTPKPTRLIERILAISTDENDIVLDFFSGSATTAHAVLQANSKDHKHRKFIMIQVNEKSNSMEFETLCDVGEERINRAGTKIKEESPLSTNDLDVGFRCFYVDSSNMKDVYYKPSETKQVSLDDFTDNIKEDRTPEDLLIQVMLELGILLSSKIETIEISGKKVFSVADGYLFACFDNDINDALVSDIAKRNPYYAVFRDSGYADDNVAANFEQIFETYSPNTVRKVL